MQEFKEFPVRPTNAQFRERLAILTEEYATLSNYFSGVEERIIALETQAGYHDRELMQSAELIIALTKLPRGAHRYATSESIEILNRCRSIASRSLDS